MLKLVSNQRRDPVRMRKIYEELKATYPWKRENELIIMTKVQYTKTTQSDNQ